MKLWFCIKASPHPCWQPWIIHLEKKKKDKQRVLATVVLSISLGNITDNKKRAAGEEPSVFSSLNKSISCAVLLGFFFHEKAESVLFPRTKSNKFSWFFYLMLFKLRERCLSEGPPMWERFVYLLGKLKLPHYLLGSFTTRSEDSGLEG